MRRVRRLAAHVPFPCLTPLADPRAWPLVLGLSEELEMDSRFDGGRNVVFDLRQRAVAALRASGAAES